MKSGSTIEKCLCYEAEKSSLRKGADCYIAKCEDVGETFSLELNRKKIPHKYHAYILELMHMLSTCSDSPKFRCDLSLGNYFLFEGADGICELRGRRDKLLATIRYEHRTESKLYKCGLCDREFEMNLRVGINVLSMD